MTPAAPASRALRSRRRASRTATARVVSTRQLARIHSLVVMLAEARGVPVPLAELARRLTVSERTVDRDLEWLRAAHVPLRGRGGLRGGVWLDVTPTPAATELTIAQVTALLLGLDSLGVPLPPSFRAVRETLLHTLAGPQLF